MCAHSGTATATVRINNARARFTEWRFTKRGDNTGWHRHGVDYIVVPQFDGFLVIDLGHGQRTKVEMRRDTPYFRKAGVEHDVISANDFDCAFVEIELLEPAG
jgi:hypothetical protein